MRHREELQAIETGGVKLQELSEVLDELLDTTGKGRPMKTTSSTAADVAALIGADRVSRPTV